MYNIYDFPVSKKFVIIFKSYAIVNVSLSGTGSWEAG